MFRAKSASFMLEWCPNNGVSSNMDCLQAYPGDQYVDCIGMDTYMDYRYGSGTSASRWAYLVNNTRGLQWQVSFASQHQKKLSIPEWGVNLDDPLFIENMHAWLVLNNYHHASYWDSNANFQGQLSQNQYPNAAAAFKSLFGA
jgi:beta-mannanase